MGIWCVNREGFEELNPVFFVWILVVLMLLIMGRNSDIIHGVRINLLHPNTLTSYIF